MVAPQRVSEGHVGMRLGDPSGPWRVTLDGRDVSMLVDEALAGRPGVVHFLLDPDQPAEPDGLPPLADLWRAGEVRIERLYGD